MERLSLTGELEATNSYDLVTFWEFGEVDGVSVVSIVITTHN